jgi:formylglycine-generating enzyme required for sulfatase activity
MVQIEGGEFMIGSTPEEVEQVAKAYEQYYLEQGRQDAIERLDTWLESMINDQLLTLQTFEIARYPTTNAQYKSFIDEDGYNADAPWWDAEGRAWLLRDDHATEGLEQRRHHKRHPESWVHPLYGIAQPNHPVVTISLYEMVAFCRWLTQHRRYNPEGYTYLLPSDAEWEYAARRTTRRIYPWGNAEPDGERANCDNTYNSTTAVGCFPAGTTPEDSIHDLAGNVWECTRSEFRKYPYIPDDGRENMDHPAEKRFTLRGGGSGNPAIFFRIPYRLDISPDIIAFGVGFRLVRYPPDKA